MFSEEQQEEELFMEDLLGAKLLARKFRVSLPSLITAPQGNTIFSNSWLRIGRVSWSQCWVGPLSLRKGKLFYRQYKGEASFKVHSVVPGEPFSDSLLFSPFCFCPDVHLSSQVQILTAILMGEVGSGPFFCPTGQALNPVSQTISSFSTCHSLSVVVYRVLMGTKWSFFCGHLLSLASTRWHPPMRCWQRLLCPPQPPPCWAPGYLNTGASYIQPHSPEHLLSFVSNWLYGLVVCWSWALQGKEGGTWSWMRLLMRQAVGGSV